MRVPIPKALTFAFILLAFFALANALPSFLTSYSRHSGIENAEEISTSGIRGRAIEAISRISPDNTCGKMTSNRRGYACDAIKNAGPCCSGNGWCGVGDDYCGPTCQPQFGTCANITIPSPPPTATDDFLCGPQNGNKKCSGGQCCSQYGYCGTTLEYCTKNCQFAFGTCSGSPYPSTISTSTTSSTPNLYPTAPPSVPNTEQCGPASGHAICNNNQCCSAAGWCGTTAEYCTTGCQPLYGTCTQQPYSPSPPPETSTELCGPANGNASCNNNMCCSHTGYCGSTEDYCFDPNWCQPAYGRCDSSLMPLGPSTQSVPRPRKGSVSYADDIYDCQIPQVVALTYDDGPCQYTSELLDLLKAYGFHATFFITGNNNKKGPIDTTATWSNLIKRMIAEGHQVASHTWSHYDLDAIGQAGRRDQMIKNEMALNNIIGKWPTYMRPPYSDCSQATGCWEDIQDLGYHRIYFDLDTDDTHHELADNIQGSKDIVKKMLDQSPQEGDFLSIQHDIIKQSVGNLSAYYFDLIKKKGWRGVTVGECLNDDEDNWYRTM